VNPADIRLGEVNITSYHLKLGVSQYTLQAEDIGAISKESHRHSMTEGVGAHANTRNTCLDAVALDNELKSVLGQRMAITRKKYLVVPRGSWLRTITIEELPNRLLYLSPDGHQPLSTPLSPYLQRSIVKVDVVKLETGKFATAYARIEQSEYDGVIPIACG